MNNGTLTLPSGSAISVTIYGTTFPIVASASYGALDKENHLFSIQHGISDIDFSAFVPSDANSGSYYFTIIIATFSNSSASFETYATALNVNLVVV